MGTFQIVDGRVVTPQKSVHLVDIHGERIVFRLGLAYLVLEVIDVVFCVSPWLKITGRSYQQKTYDSRYHFVEHGYTP
jgi:hypothetical protein